MSLSTVVAEAITAVNGLVTTVKGQFSKWDGQVQGKIAELESRVNIVLHGFSDGAFFVGGSKDVFYPVLFRATSLSFFTIELFRHSVHQDSGYNGNIFLKMRGKASFFGHGAYFLDVEKYTYAGKTRCAKVAQDYYGGEVILWLEGQATYYFESKNLEFISVFLAQIPVSYFNNGGAYAPITEIQL